MRALATAASLLGRNKPTPVAGPIGVDFALDSAHMVQLEKATGLPPQVRATASIAFDGSRQDILQNPARFRALIRSGLESDRFIGRKAVISIPSIMFRTLSINYQTSGGKEQEQAAIVKAMEDRLDGKLSEFVIDYLPVDSRSKTNDRLAIVAVSERKSIIEFLELSRMAGLEVDALEIGPVAISRLVGTLSDANGSGNMLVINSGRRASYLTLIAGTDLLFDQEVDFGENSLIRQAAETLDMPEEMVRELLMESGVYCGTRRDDASKISESELAKTMSEVLRPHFLTLVDEIKRVCMYAAAETRGGAVTQVYLLGSIARWPGTDRLLTSLTGVDVAKVPDLVTLFPADGMTAVIPTGNLAPELAVATGSALRGIGQHA